MKYQKGQKWVIEAFQHETPEADLITHRLRELGLREGSILIFEHASPFQGPKIFQTPTCLLALRAEELSCLKMKMI